VKDRRIAELEQYAKWGGPDSTYAWALAHIAELENQANHLRARGNAWKSNVAELEAERDRARGATRLIGEAHDRSLARVRALGAERDEAKRSVMRWKLHAEEETKRSRRLAAERDRLRAALAKIAESPTIYAAILKKIARAALAGEETP
jgi:chromosome segregation ATPase